MFGVALVNMLGFDLTGRTLKDLGPQVRPHVLANYQTVCRTGRPLLTRNRLAINHEFRRLDTLALPLSDDGIGVTRVLSGIYPALGGDARSEE